MNWLLAPGKQHKRLAELESAYRELKEENLGFEGQLRDAREQLRATEDGFAIGKKQFAQWWKQQKVYSYLPEYLAPPFDWFQEAAEAQSSDTQQEDTQHDPLDSIRPGTTLDLSRVAQFPERHPVFILGAHRSGTTAMCQALRTCPSMFGWEEGQVFPALVASLALFHERWQRSLAELWDLHLFAAGQLDVYSLLNGVLRSVDDTHAAWCSERGALRWVDKTPILEAVLMVGFLRHVYPKARFIFMVRHPVTNALSNVRKFSEKTIWSATRYWSDMITSWF